MKLRYSNDDNRGLLEDLKSTIGSDYANYDFDYESILIKLREINTSYYTDKDLREIAISFEMNLLSEIASTEVLFKQFTIKNIAVIHQKTGMLNSPKILIKWMTPELDSFIMEKITSFLADKTPVLNLPFPEYPVELIGRADDLALIGDSLKYSDKGVFITAIGGVGKTELCKAYIKCVKANYENIGWFIFTQDLKTTLLGQTDIYNSNITDMDYRYAEILSLLNRLTTDTIIVFDNITDISDADLTFISKLKCKVLLTSREPKETFKDIFNIIELPFLNDDDCKRLFLRFYNNMNYDDLIAKEQKALDKVIELTSNHTLAIELLAKTSKASRNTVQGIYNALLGEGFSLKGIQEGVAREGESQTEHFIKHMSKLYNLANIDEVEISILKNLCILPPIKILDEDIKRWLGLESYSGLNTLCKKGLIRNENQNDIFYSTMHNVICEVLMYKLEPKFEECKNLVQALAKDISYTQYQIEKYNSPYKIHSLNVSNYFSKSFINERVLSNLYYRLACIFDNEGEYDKALSWYMNDLAICKKVLGVNHLSIGTTYNNIGGVYRLKGEYDKALSWYMKALSIYEKAHGVSHPSTGTIYNNIGGVYEAKGEYDEALSWYMKALAICEKAHGVNHPLTGTIYNNIGAVYESKGEYDEALIWYKKDLAICEKVHGVDHPSIGAIYNNIGGVYELKGEYDEALIWHMKALAIKEKVHGVNHPSTGTTYNNIGVVYKLKGESDEALIWFKKALAICKKVHGVNHPSTEMTYNNIGGVYASKGEYDDALIWFKKALAICKKVHGVNHPSTGRTYNNIGGVYGSKREYEKSLEYYFTSLIIMIKTLGYDHPNIKSILVNTHYTYIQSGKLESEFQLWLDEKIGEL